MRYGSREIMNVVLKDIKTGEPVVYLESLTSSSIELVGSTVYARGGKGHPKLIGWDAERDITLTMEDALISKESLAVLTGSKFNKGAKAVHKKEVVTVSGDLKITLQNAPLANQPLFIYKTTDGTSMKEKVNFSFATQPVSPVIDLSEVSEIAANDKLIVDYYYSASASTQSMTITSDIFPGTYRLEGTTFWRDEDGYDVEAIYTIPKLKINAGFTIAMASSGDPQPFSFTCEALKDKNSTSLVTIDLLENE